MNKIEITEPYSHDLILQAQDNVIAQYPKAAQFKLVEAVDSSQLALDANTKCIYYDPDMPKYVSLDEMTQWLMHLYLVFWIETEVPACSYFPLVEESLHH